MEEILSGRQLDDIAGDEGSALRFLATPEETNNSFGLAAESIQAHHQRR